MNKDNGKFNHLITNLERISSEDSIFNTKSGQKAFVSLGKGNIRSWFEKLLPNTRLILEPNIIGSRIGLQYINGNLNKAINKNSEDITEEIYSLKKIPKRLSITKRIEIQGILYVDKNSFNKSNKIELLKVQQEETKMREVNFCAFHIFSCKLNQFRSLQELNKLNFEVPQCQITNFISEIEIYRQCWTEGKLFKSYPTSGIVLKINSKKLQKYLSKNRLSINWAYAIN